jgi:hypothetical protein
MDWGNVTRMRGLPTLCPGSRVDRETLLVTRCLISGYRRHVAGMHAAVPLHPRRWHVIAETFQPIATPLSFGSTGLRVPLPPAVSSGSFWKVLGLFQLNSF